MSPRTPAPAHEAVEHLRTAVNAGDLRLALRILSELPPGTRDRIWRRLLRQAQADARVFKYDGRTVIDLTADGDAQELLRKAE